MREKNGTLYVEPEYMPIKQKSHLCMPTSIQWIFIRHGKYFDQEELAEYCNSFVPSTYRSHIKNTKLFKYKGYNGTLFGDAYNGLVKLIKKKRMVFEAKIYRPPIEELEKFVIANIKYNIDMIVGFDKEPVYHKKKKSKTTRGHCCVISAINTNTKNIQLGDPSRCTFQWVKLKDLEEGLFYNGVQRGIITIENNK